MRPRNSFLSAFAALVVVALTTGVAVAATLGVGPATGGTAVAINVPQGSDIEMRATTSGAHFLLVDGELYSWGLNDYGVLARPDVPVDTYVADPAPIDRGEIPAGVSIVMFDAQQSHALALGDDGELYSWGENSSRKVGRESIPEGVNVLSPIRTDRGDIPAGEVVVDIAALGSSSAVLTDAGKLYGWGYPDFGTGVTSVTAPKEFVLSDFPTGVAIERFDAGMMNLFGFGSDGEVYGWGTNLWGQVDPNNEEQTRMYGYRLDWLPLGPGETVVTVVGGLMHVSALTSEGRVLSWGVRSILSSVGDGVSGSSGVLITGVFNAQGELPPGSKIVWIGSSPNHSAYVLTDDGELYMWGWTLPDFYNTFVLSLPGSPHLSPVKADFPGLLPGEIVVDVAQGSALLLRTSFGRVLEWGVDYDLVETDPNTPITPTPVTVAHVEVGDITFGDLPAAGTISFENQEIVSPAHTTGEVDVQGQARLALRGGPSHQFGSINLGSFEYLSVDASPGVSPSSEPSVTSSPTPSRNPVQSGGSGGAETDGALADTGSDLRWAWLPIAIVSVSVVLLGFANRQRANAPAA